ncbi:hypothetical protein DCC39_16600 [Pueribacillus theae]|uniref:Uncharacterized protein n=1 Tax=Pueribacillus theae TaxID=2171751 RepID=A0A2U1JRD4_9BACI|nr:hypothetical protein [Pueribacillus theae]PWA07519.1 hypothetical protein DCC39_16600 [Pueribacillus theae]
MVGKFLLERWSWILLFLALQAFIIFVALIDAAIPLPSILYVVFLSVLIFLIFITQLSQTETGRYTLI